jgi:16S rRNA (guanine527-N7)-methyltransferase
LGLENAIATKSRAEEIDEKFDFVVSRAVTTLNEFYHWTKHLIKRDGFNILHNGMLYLKGGDLKEEIRSLNRDVMIFELSNFFKEEYFETKKVVYIG